MLHAPTHRIPTREDDQDSIIMGLALLYKDNFAITPFEGFRTALKKRQKDINEGKENVPPLEDYRYRISPREIYGEIRRVERAGTPNYPFNENKVHYLSLGKIAKYLKDSEYVKELGLTVRENSIKLLLNLFCENHNQFRTNFQPEIARLSLELTMLRYMTECIRHSYNLGDFLSKKAYENMFESLGIDFPKDPDKSLEELLKEVRKPRNIGRQGVTGIHMSLAEEFVKLCRQRFEYSTERIAILQKDVPARNWFQRLFRINAPKATLGYAPFPSAERLRIEKTNEGIALQKKKLANTSDIKLALTLYSQFGLSEEEKKILSFASENGKIEIDKCNDVDNLYYHYEYSFFSRGTESIKIKTPDCVTADDIPLKPMIDKIKEKAKTIRESIEKKLNDSIITELPDESCRTHIPEGTSTGGKTTSQSGEGAYIRTRNRRPR